MAEKMDFEVNFLTKFFFFFFNFDIQIEFSREIFHTNSENIFSEINFCLLRSVHGMHCIQILERIINEI